ncbi:MAG: hypothetical protein Q7R95_09690, partial [bacterium]|nr:hypothetical protein [bacterium]
EMPNNISQENQIRISPQTIKISGHQTRGYFLDHNKINNMKKSTQTTINGIGSDLTGEQKQFFVNLYETIGYAESCYPVGNRVFSIEKQVGVKNGAYGFIQVETYTAIDVISQAIDAQRSNNPKVSMSYKNLDANCRQIFGMNLQGIKSYIQSKPAESLNNDNISMLVLFLKFRNRGFKDIQNFYDTNTMKNYTQNDYVSIWKNVWNTSKGGGTIPGGIQKNNEMRKLINGSK